MGNRGFWGGGGMHEYLGNEYEMWGKINIPHENLGEM